MDPRQRMMKAVHAKERSHQCIYCGYWDGEHHEACPKTDEDKEVWQAGFQAAMDHDNCYAESGSNYWLGWNVAILRQLASENHEDDVPKAAS